MKLLLIGLFSFFASLVHAQSFEQKTIGFFGAKGDGKTNDQPAFNKAADYFNKRGGNGKLIISKGIYIVGKQTFTGGQLNKAAYEGEDVMRIVNVQNFSITGESGAKLQYQNGMRMGSFSPVTGKENKNGNNFVNKSFAAIPGVCFYIINSTSVTISNIELDGNNQNIILGGTYGDVGRQVAHTGIFILNSKKILVDNMNVHHFGLDGIIVSNKPTNTPDNIQLTNSSFVYNSRQGLSWVGGNQLNVKNCKFNHTGKSKFSSPPGAGVDIEAESGSAKNGIFENCEFTDNTGPALVANNGSSSDCTFTDCTFWGTTSWSIWVTKPGYSFRHCNIYGSIAHGYNSPNDNDATKFYDCTFEDKPYDGKPPYGNFLVETNGVNRMLFSNCNFISHTKKLCWFVSSAKNEDEKYQISNCTFVINNSNLPANDFVGMMKGAAIKNSTFTFTDPDAKKKRYYIAGYGEASNADLGGNKVITK